MEIIDLTRILKEADKNKSAEIKSYKHLVEIVKATILDPADSIREHHVKTLNKFLGNTLQRGFMADNQLYIVIRVHNPHEYQMTEITYCLCDMPKTYLGSLSKSHRFNRK